MVENQSPFVQQWRRGIIKDVILELLSDRFGPEVSELRADLELVEDRARLKELNKLAVTCADLGAFKAALCHQSRV